MKQPFETNLQTFLKENKIDKNIGLTSQIVEDLIKKEGKNKLEEKKKHELLAFFFDQLIDPITLILLLCVAIKLYLRSLNDALAISGVVVFNFILGFFQKHKAISAVEGLKKLLIEKAKVIRDGIKKEVMAEDIVPKDLIILESGMRVPADARLIETLNLFVDESMLTGESIGIEKNAEAVCKENSSVSSQLNMVFSGSLVTSGRAIAYVTATGNRTELGKIAKSIESIKMEPSPLQKRLKNFSKILSITLIGLISFIVVLGLFKGFTFQELFLLGLSLTVSAIPEGLPLAITLCLIIGVQKMASQKAIVKDMACVETLGSTGVICTDKTGTLTCNQMTVKSFYCDGQYVDVSGVGYEPKGEISIKQRFEKLAMVSALCHETSLFEKEGKWICEGDPTEASLIVLSKKLGFNTDSFETKLVIPFESETRYMAMFAKTKQEGYLLIKGSLDKLLDMCEMTLSVDETLTPLHKEKFLEAQKNFSLKHLRTLALAYLPLKDINDLKLPIKKAVLLSLVGIEAP